MKGNIKAISICLVFTLFFSVMMPAISVFASAPDNTGDYAYVQINGTTTLENKENASAIDAACTNGTVTINGTGLYSDGNNMVYVPAGGNITITTSPNDNYVGRLTVGGQNKGTSTTLENLANNNVPTIVDIDFDEEEEEQNQGQQGNQGQGNQGEGNQGQGNQGGPEAFDGKAYFVWMSGNKVCYHKFTGLTGLKADQSGYEMNYVNVTDITDQSGNNGTYTWGQDKANWVLARDMEENGVVKANLTELYVFGDGTDFDHGVQLNPTNAKDGENSICSNGDMNFRVTIYRDNYQAVKFGTNASDYTYFPGFWDQTFFTSTVDISGTTKENPAVYESYLLEPTLSFGVGDNSKSNRIKSVKALDVNEKAVSISEVDGVYKVKFNSSYYDHVVFEITTIDGNKYYIMLARMTLRIMDNFAPGVTDNKLIAQLFYPTTNNYDDFEVVATIVSKDGSTKTSTLEVESTENTDGGKGLYGCTYTVGINKDTDIGAYFTVVYKGALTNENYGGTFSGSGKGVYYNFEGERRFMEYNK